MAYEYVPYTGPVVTRDDARAAGLKQFFTGVPCKHGHLSQRTVGNACTTCKVQRAAAAYEAEPEDGRARNRAKSKACKAAKRVEDRAARDEAREPGKAAGREYAAAHGFFDYTGPTISRAEAKAAGLTRFFTGKTCKHGHLSERTTANGGCITCNALTCEDLYRAETPKARAVRNARQKEWKAANREQVRAANREYSKAHREQANAWKAANRDRLNAAEREARKRNPEIYKASVDRYLASEAGQAKRRAYYKANAETIKQRTSEWAKQNPDLARETRQAWYRANTEAAKQRAREWSEANPEAYLASRRTYRARKNKAEGKHTGDEIKALYAKQGGRCIYCRKELGDKYHADHIQPLARGGSNWISNIQLLCAKCNNHKRATDPVEFARRVGLLI